MDIYDSSVVLLVDKEKEDIYSFSWNYRKAVSRFALDRVVYMYMLCCRNPVMHIHVCQTHHGTPTHTASVKFLCRNSALPTRISWRPERQHSVLIPSLPYPSMSKAGLFSQLFLIAGGQMEKKSCLETSECTMYV